MLSGAFPGNQETLYSFPEDPSFYVANPAQFPIDYAAGAATTPASDGSFSQSLQRLGALRAGFVERIAASDDQCRTALADDVWIVHRIGTQPGAESGVDHARSAAGSTDAGSSA